MTTPQNQPPEEIIRLQIAEIEEVERGCEGTHHHCRLMLWHYKNLLLAMLPKDSDSEE